MRFKTWLRRPNPVGDTEVELIGEWGWYWKSGHRQQRAERSVMAELLSPEETRHLEVAEGRWFLPGPPP